MDADVRDKILCLVEDYAKVLPQPEFREAYEYLLVGCSVHECSFTFHH